MIRTGRRIFNQRALEAWFARLPENWEVRFGAEYLTEGRALYRMGLVGDVELSGDDAIVHFRFDRGMEYYVVVTLDKEVLRFRSSTREPELSTRLYIAALYEIEELMADEIGDLPPDPPKAVAGERSEPTSKVSPAGDTSMVPSSGPALYARPIEVQVLLNDKELVLDPSWINVLGPSEPLFHRAAVAGESGPKRVGRAQGASQLITARNDLEREHMIRITSMAKRAGFRFARKRRCFALLDPGKILHFTTEAWHQWKPYFKMVIDTSAKPLLAGAQPLSIGGRARTSDGRGFRIDWDIRVGRTVMDKRTLRQLGRRRPGTHILPGVGAVTVTEEQLETLGSWGGASGTDPDEVLPQYMLFSLFAGRRVSLVLDHASEEWMERIKGGIGEPLPVPPFLRPYQRDGVAWLNTLTQLQCHPLLADEMGLGKTVQVLALLAGVERTCASSDIIVCPASVVPVWVREVARWFPQLRIRILARGAFESVGDAPDLWVASYTQLRRHRGALGQQQFRFAILDEAQFIKNPDAKVSQACYQLRATFRVAMTGTPVENRAEDLWALFRFLMPGILGTRSDFSGHVTGESRFEYLEKVRQQLQPFILRRTRDRVAPELPPKVENALICPLTAVQRSLYERIVRDAQGDLGNEWDVVERKSLHFFTILTRLRQVCCDPGLLPGHPFSLENSGKLEVLMRYLEEALASGRKVVVFSQFVKLLTHVKAALKVQVPQAKLYTLTGQTTDRGKPVDAFQNEPGAAVILVSLKAGGTGITLHAADTVFLLDPWWNPAVESQAVDRVHRIGQSKPVLVYRMVTEGTVEEKIEQLKEHKRALFDTLVGADSETSTWRSAFDNLNALIALSEGAHP